MPLGPACPQTHSLWAAHRRERFANFSTFSVLSRSSLHTVHCGATDYRQATVDETLHRVGRRLGFRFVTGSASSFPIGTGLADTAALPIFASLRFWSCYRSSRGFPLKVRPFALKGRLLPTFPCFTGIQLAVRRRTLKRLVHLTETFFLGREKPETVPSLRQKGTRLSSP